MNCPFPDSAIPRVLQPGQWLWESGQEATSVAWVESGLLEVVQHSALGEDAVLNRLGPGEIAGEMSCLDGQPHSATLRAAQPTRVRLLLRPQFLQWLREQPERWEQLSRKQAQRIRALSQKVAEVSFEPVRLRLARFLLAQSQTELTITQQQLAENLAATRESISKAISGLKAQGLLNNQRGRLCLLDREGLQSWVDSSQS